MCYTKKKTNRGDRVTKEDLQQIAELIRQQDEKQERRMQQLEQRMQEQNEKLEQRMQEQMKQQTETITQMMDEKIQGVRDEMSNMRDEMENMMEDKIRGVKVLIENDIGKRIDALFDGYKLTHEKQWELEHKIELLEKRLERVEQKVS